MDVWIPYKVKMSSSNHLTFNSTAYFKTFSSLRQFKLFAISSSCLLYTGFIIKNVNVWNLLLLPCFCIVLFVIIQVIHIIYFLEHHGPKKGEGG